MAPSQPPHPGRELPGRVFWPLWAGLVGAWALVLFLIAPWDLPLSAAVADRSDLLGRLVMWFGEIPGWVAVCAALFLLVAGRKPGSRWRPCRPLAVAILVLAIVHPLAITQAFKFLWGRVRFRDLGIQFAGYTPFYLPAGPGAGLSFPSGHVAMACVMSPLVFHCARLGRRRFTGLALMLVGGYGILVAWGRIVAAAHYLTDCVFSFGLSFLLAAVLVRWFSAGLAGQPTVVE